MIAVPLLDHAAVLVFALTGALAASRAQLRSEERRVGKECS